MRKNIQSAFIGAFSINRLWPRVNSGQHNTHLKHNKSLILKRICIAMIVVAILQSVKLLPLLSKPALINFVLNHVANLLIHLCLFTVVLYLLHRQKFKLARQLLIASFCSFLGFACWLWVSNIGLHYYFLLAMFITSYLFDGLEKKQLISWCIIEIILFSYASAYLPNPYSMAHLSVSSLSPAVTLNTDSLARLYLVNTLVFGLSCGICALFIQTIITQNWQQLHTLKANQQLLLNKVFPNKIASNLLSTNHQSTNSASQNSQLQTSNTLGVLFLDICEFTKIATNPNTNGVQSWQRVYSMFSQFDKAIAHLDAKRIKVNGDQYILLVGLSCAGKSDTFIAQQTLEASLSLLSVSDLDIKQGLAFGEVTYGVFDVNQPQFDIWGQTVITAARLEALAEANEVICDQKMYQLSKTKHHYKCSKKHIKGLGIQNIYHYMHTNDADE